MQGLFMILLRFLCYKNTNVQDIEKILEQRGIALPAKVENAKTCIPEQKVSQRDVNMQYKEDCFIALMDAVAPLEGQLSSKCVQSMMRLYFVEAFLLDSPSRAPGHRPSLKLHGKPEAPKGKPVDPNNPTGIGQLFEGKVAKVERPPKVDAQPLVPIQDLSKKRFNAVFLQHFIKAKLGNEDCLQLLIEKMDHVRPATDAEREDSVGFGVEFEGLEMLCALGVGNHGIVFSFQTRDGIKIAGKVQCTTEFEISEARYEACVPTTTHNHPHIVKIYGVSFLKSVEEKENKVTIITFMEQGEGTLDHHISTLNDETRPVTAVDKAIKIANYMKQIWDALLELVQKG
ncbi:MAG: hypothetical protein SGARI_000184, partial [Bacillariaceae sp.]